MARSVLNIMLVFAALLGCCHAVQNILGHPGYDYYTELDEDEMAVMEVQIDDIAENGDGPKFLEVYVTLGALDANNNVQVYWGQTAAECMDIDAPLTDFAYYYDPFNSTGPSYYGGSVEETETSIPGLDLIANKVTVYFPLASAVNSTTPGVQGSIYVCWASDNGDVSPIVSIWEVDALGERLPVMQWHESAFTAYYSVAEGEWGTPQMLMPTDSDDCSAACGCNIIYAKVDTLSEVDEDDIVLKADDMLIPDDASLADTGQGPFSSDDGVDYYVRPYQKEQTTGPYRFATNYCSEPDAALGLKPSLLAISLLGAVVAVWLH